MIELLKNQMDTSLAQLGRPNIDEIDRSIVVEENSVNLFWTRNIECLRLSIGTSLEIKTSRFDVAKPLFTACFPHTAERV